jgi:hypothetical protein
MLVDLSRTIKEALLGPLGDHYLETRQDILYDTSCHLWSKYLLPLLQKIDTYQEMRNQKEFYGDFVDQIDDIVIRIKGQFMEAFNVMHRILSRLNYV